MVVVDLLNFAKLELWILVRIGFNLKQSILLFYFDDATGVSLEEFVSLAFLEAAYRYEFFACVFDTHGAG
jgi:hypothetical protein